MNRNLQSNRLSGAIPTQLGNLRNLQLLYYQTSFHFLYFEEKIRNLTKKKKKKKRNLKSNLFYESIPTHLGNLSNLQQL